MGKLLMTTALAGALLGAAPALAANTALIFVGMRRARRDRLATI
jgi:hypothetical protein